MVEWKPWMTVVGIIIVLVLVGGGIGLYFGLRGSSSSELPPSTPPPENMEGQPVGGHQGHELLSPDEGWDDGRSLSGLTLPSPVNPNEYLVYPVSDQLECEQLAADYMDGSLFLEIDYTPERLDFIQYHEGGDGEPNTCSLNQDEEEGVQYKQISFGKCENMAENNINTFGLKWHGIISTNECERAVPWLIDNALLTPTNSWYQTTGNNPDRPVQVQKNAFDHTQSEIVAWLHNPDANLGDHGYVGPSATNLSPKDGIKYNAFENDRGRWEKHTASELPLRTDCNPGSNWCSIPSEINDSTGPAGCYVNLDNDGHKNYHFGLRFNNNMDGDATLQRPVVCYAHTGTTPSISDRTSFLRINHSGGSPEDDPTST